MSTRKIKDAKDLSTNELIYFKGHAQATYMSDGRTVEEAISSSTGGSGESNSGSNVQAVVREGYSELENRPIRDAKDLTTGELVYFTGDANYITCDGGMLIDYINDKTAGARIYYWDVEAIDSTDEQIPDEVANILFSGQGIVFLNGGIAKLFQDSEFKIESFVVHENIIYITTVYVDDNVRYNKVTINQYSISGGGGTVSTIVNYGTCSIAAATIAKTTSITGFNLVTGARVSVNFINGNTAASMTLNVSSTGAKAVVYRGNTNTPTLDAGTYDFVYTGSQWELLTSKANNRFTVNRASISAAVQPNTFIRFYYSTGVASLNVSSTTTADPLYEYAFSFNSGSTATTFTYPSAWKWANGNTPIIKANKTYHVSVVNNCAVIAEF